MINYVLSLLRKLPQPNLDMLLANSFSLLAGVITWNITANTALSLLAVTIVYAIIVTFLYTWYARIVYSDRVYLETTLTTEDSVMITIVKDGVTYTKLVVIKDVNDVVAGLSGAKGNVKDIVGYRRIDFVDDKTKKAILSDIQKTLDK